MNVLKKVLVLGAIGVMLAVPGYAKVVTGSQSVYTKGYFKSKFTSDWLPVTTVAYVGTVNITPNIEVIHSFLKIPIIMSPFTSTLNRFITMLVLQAIIKLLFYILLFW